MASTADVAALTGCGNGGHSSTQPDSWARLFTRTSATSAAHSGGLSCCSAPPPLLLLRTCPVHHAQTQKRSVPYLFVRGDGIILVSPPLRS